MSDIVIRGIEMPKDKPLNLSIYPNGEVVLFCIQGRDVYDNECNYGDYKHKKIAVELPPHGRLIDAETLKGILSRVPSKGIRNYFFAEVGQFIDEAPTVVEGEE